MLWSQSTVCASVCVCARADAKKQSDLCGCSLPRPTFPSKEARKWDAWGGGNIVLHCVMSGLRDNRLISSCLFCPERELKLCQLWLCRTHEAPLFSDWGGASWCGWMFTWTTRSLLYNSVGCSGEQNEEIQNWSEGSRRGGSEEQRGRRRSSSSDSVFYLILTNPMKIPKPVMFESVCQYFTNVTGSCWNTDINFVKICLHFLFISVRKATIKCL